MSFALASLSADMLESAMSRRRLSVGECSMRNLWPLLLVVLALGTISGCGDGGSSVRDGDVVTPIVTNSGQWTAGKSEQISVRLKAKNKDGSGERSVGFGGIANDANPTATVTF